MGEQSLDRDFKRMILSAIIATCRGRWYPDCNEINLLYERTQPGSPARRLIVDIYVFAARATGSRCRLVGRSAICPSWLIWRGLICYASHAATLHLIRSISPGTGTFRTSRLMLTPAVLRTSQVTTILTLSGN
jgi:hypothetical protein